MKRYLASILLLAALLTSFSASAQEEKTSKPDTLYVNFLEGLDKGDIIPFKYIYQRAKIGVGEVQDTALTCSITKDISFEVVENNKEKHIVHFTVTQDNFIKVGPECNNFRYSGSTCLVGDGFTYDVYVTYSGNMYGPCPDEMYSRYQKNLDYISDTLATSPYVSKKLSKEEWTDIFSFMKDTSYVLSHASSDFSDLFFFGAYDYEPDEVYTSIDSVLCDADQQYYYIQKRFGWDKTFSENNEEFKNTYVFRSSQVIDPHLFLEILYSPHKFTKEELEDLIQKADPKRLKHIVEITEIADKAMGMPILLEKETLEGYYEKVGEDYVCLKKEILILDFDKLGADEGDEDEEDDDDSPRYDDYGFIKVK